MCKWIVGLLFSLVPTVVWAESGCRFTEWDDYQGVRLLKHPTDVAYIYGLQQVKIDADGAPNAYHPGDLHLDCVGGVGFKGLDCPENAGYPNQTWWRDVLVADPADPGRALVQRSGPFAGFFVSKTSLEDRSKPVTDPGRYVDSTRVPYIVFPGNFYKKKGTGRLGDLGFAINIRTGARSPFVVADIGPPNAPLGEMSIALAEALGGSSPNPRTGAGVPHGKVLYVVFPYSGRDNPWPLGAPDLSAKAAALLESVGGIQAIEACGGSL